MWESNASLPAIRYVPAILSFLGYDPFPPAQTFADRLTTARKVLGLSQRRLALSLGVDPGTLQSWEAGRHKPTERSVERVERFLDPGTSQGWEAGKHQPSGKSLEIIGRILQSREGLN
jgi:DNA-binding transcriptional regulator YiaG